MAGNNPSILGADYSSLAPENSLPGIKGDTFCEPVSLERASLGTTVTAGVIGVRNIHDYSI